jgi:hypothetical protein
MSSIHADAAGLRQHYVFVNRQTGQIEIIGVWEPADAAASVAPLLEPAWSGSGAVWDEPTLETRGRRTPVSIRCLAEPWPA